MTGPAPRPGASHDCDRLLKELLERLARGERTSIHELCSEFPGYAPELRARYDAWRSAESARQRRELSGDSIELPACGVDDPAWTAFLRQLKHGDTYRRFRIDGEIARSASAVLQRAYDPDARRPVALKTALCKSGPTLGRFLEEAQVLAQLDHPGIVPVHEIGLDLEGRPYFAMRLLTGEDLRAVFEKVRKGEDGWTRTRAIVLLIKVCEAMAHAHSKGVVHRDLRPANVVVGPHGEAYVMEWGRARVLAEPETLAPPEKRAAASDPDAPIVFTERPKTTCSPDSQLLAADGLMLGSPAYMAPEQIEGDLAAVGPAADVYAVGAMLYELVTGEVPYCDHGLRLSPSRILAAVGAGPPTPIAELVPGVPPALVAVIERAMARPSEQRTRSMDALASELHRWLDEAVTRGAVAPPPRSRFRAFFAVVVAVVLAAAAIFAMRGARDDAPPAAASANGPH